LSCSANYLDIHENEEHAIQLYDNRRYTSNTTEHSLTITCFKRRDSPVSPQRPVSPFLCSLVRIYAICCREEG